MPGLTLLVTLACTLPPTRGEVEEELATRRARSQLPAGECWTRDRLFTDEDPSVCVPGPWFESSSSFGGFLGNFSPWWEREWDPDELLVLGTTLIHSGEVMGVMLGVRMQTKALRSDPSPQAIARMRPYRISGKEIWERQAPDSMVHGYGLLVLANGGWRERLGWARIRDGIDQKPTPTAAKWEALAPPDRSPEAIMWPNLTLLEDDLPSLDAAWEQAIEDLPVE